MKKLFTTFILILFAINLMATVYWVSPTGTDAATGRTRSAAWQTLDKVSAEMQSGDIIRFKRASTWNDTLFINASNVQLIAWGEGREPVIQYVYIDTATQSISFQNITVTNFLYPVPPEPEPEQYPETYSGTIYYVSSSTGSDSNPGTKAEPFETITKVNTLTLSGDDAVLFNSVDTFIGTITVGQSGNAGNPITIGAYGVTSSKPKIYGSELITGWTLHSGNIYKATFATDVQQLFLNGNKMQVARLTNSGYNTISSISSQTVFTTNAASQATNYYVGATVIFRMQNYFSDTRVVTASTGSTLTVNSAPVSTIAASQSVLIMNKLEFLDAPGEWYYDTNTNTVYLWTPDGDSPSGYEVRGSTVDNGITLYSVLPSTHNNYITIKNIEFLHQKKSGVYITGTAGSSHVKIDSCGFKGQDQYGIYALVDEISYHEWTNNRFSNINGNAIFSYNIAQSEISYNTIDSIGLMELWGISNVTGDYGYNNNGTGIEISYGGSTIGGTNIVSYNKISNTGYNGILWRGVADVAYNYFNGTCLSKSDGGAIYTASPTSEGSIIHNNIIDYVFGNMLGGTWYHHSGEGIYLDEGSKGCTVYNNIVINASNSGILAHIPFNHVIRENTLFDNRFGFYYSNTFSGTTYFRDNKIVTGSDTDDYDVRQFLVKKGTGGVSLDSNIYVNGFTSDLVFNDGTHRDFAGWKTATSQDANSTYIGTDLVGKSQRLVYNNTLDTLKFYINAATDAVDENGTAIPDSFYVAPFESVYVRSLYVDSISTVKSAIPPIEFYGNLIADYDFSETSGTVSNDLIGSADGTINGGAIVDGTPLTLDGIDDYVSLPLPTVMSSNAYNVDFSFNIKFTIFATPAAAKRLFYQATSFTRGVQVVLNTNRDIYAIITENDVPTTSGRITSGGVSINTSHNLTFTWNATTNTLQMYLDGTEITATYSSNSLAGNSSGMRIGASIAAAYINSDIYELSVFDKQLSGAEVLQWINR